MNNFPRCWDERIQLEQCWLVERQKKISLGVLFEKYVYILTRFSIQVAPHAVYDDFHQHLHSNNAFWITRGLMGFAEANSINSHQKAEYFDSKQFLYTFPEVNVYNRTHNSCRPYSSNIVDTQIRTGGPKAVNWTLIGINTAILHKSLFSTIEPVTILLQWKMLLIIFYGNLINTAKLHICN